MNMPHFRDLDLFVYTRVTWNFCYLRYFLFVSLPESNGSKYQHMIIVTERQHLLGSRKARVILRTPRGTYRYYTN